MVQEDKNLTLIGHHDCHKVLSQAGTILIQDFKRRFRGCRTRVHMKCLLSAFDFEDLAFAEQLIMINIPRKVQYCMIESVPSCNYREPGDFYQW